MISRVYIEGNVKDLRRANKSSKKQPWKFGRLTLKARQVIVIVSRPHHPVWNYRIWRGEPKSYSQITTLSIYYHIFQNYGSKVYEKIHFLLSLVKTTSLIEELRTPHTIEPALRASVFYLWGRLIWYISAGKSCQALKVRSADARFT